MRQFILAIIVNLTDALFIAPLAAKVKVSYTVQKRRLASCIQKTKGTDRSMSRDKSKL